MKRSITLAAMLLISAALSAQVEKNIVYPCARGTITYTEPSKESQPKGQTALKVLGAVFEAAAGQSTVTTNHGEYADAVCNAIAGGIGRAYRIRVVDGQFTEAELAQNTPLLYFDGSISSITTTSRFKVVKDNEGKVRNENEYSAQVNATINIKDARTDVIVRTINLNSSSWSQCWHASTEKSMAYVLGNISDYLASDMNFAFPLYASVIEGNNAKNDKQKDVYIDLGTDFGIPVGMTFTVYKPRTIAGKEANQEIGKLKVKEVLGPEISLCQVKNGGKEIKALLDAGEPILIMGR